MFANRLLAVSIMAAAVLAGAALAPPGTAIASGSQHLLASYSLTPHAQRDASVDQGVPPKDHGGDRHAYNVWPDAIGETWDQGTGISLTLVSSLHSTNGDPTWSSYVTASVSGSDGITTTQSMTSTSVPSGADSATQDLIDFIVADMTGDVDTAQGRIPIDTTPPTPPTSLTSGSHTPNEWSNDSTISMSWSGASDGGSGVSGYSLYWDTSSDTLPDTTVDTSDTSTTSPAMTSGNNYYFHIRAGDAAGNWSATAIHLGPYYIDTNAPSSWTLSPATSGSSSFTVSWAGFDAHSGIASYDVQYRDVTTGGSWTDWKSNTTTTSGSFYGLDGHIYQFRSQARDQAGNVEANHDTYDAQTSVDNVAQAHTAIVVTQEPATAGIVH